MSLGPVLGNELSEGPLLATLGVVTDGALWVCEGVVGAVGVGAGVTRVVSGAPAGEVAALSLEEDCGVELLVVDSLDLLVSLVVPLVESVLCERDS